MRKVSLLLTVFVLFSASAAKAEMSCQDVVGSSICRSMDKITHSMQSYCTGDSCYALWQRQLDMMRQFTHNYENNVGFGTSMSLEMGSLAYSAADLICRVKSTGACEWMKALYYAKVDALYVLEEIQSNASLTNIRRCSLTYTCP